MLITSFWLSFLAVGWLLLITTTRRVRSRSQQLLRLHVFLALGLSLLLSILHQSIPWASPFANLLAVPIVTIAVVPFVLLGVVASPFSIYVAAFFWNIAAAVWHPLWLYLGWLAENVAPYELSSTPSWLVIAMAYGWVCLALVPVLKTLWLAAGALLAVLSVSRQPELDVGDVHLTVLDVGQSLAAVVRTTNHVLAYDTGPSFGE